MEDKIVRAHRRPEKQILAWQMRRAMTEMETRLWAELRNNRLGNLHFRRQQVIDGFIVDFYCRAARIVIECDGDVHLGQEEYDQERDRILAIHHLRILRFSNKRIQEDIFGVLADILTVAQNYRDSSSQP